MYWDIEDRSLILTMGKDTEELKKIVEAEDCGGDDIVEPFDPKKVDIEQKTMTIGSIVDRLKYNEIKLDPDYQRSGDLWEEKEQSRLIESLIIRIPLPSFYFDCDEDGDGYIVVDGLQRLCAIRNFMIPSDGDDLPKLRLKDLEYLKEFEGKGYEELPSNIQRRINEQQIVAFVIRKGTPERVKNSIFKRINTGGLVLTDGEIKNAIYRGKVADFLKECSEFREFKEATGNKIPSQRMLDREFVYRYVTFYVNYLSDFTAYNGNVEDSVNDVLTELKSCDGSQLKDLGDRFRTAMALSVDLFGDKAFRKINSDAKFGKINKPLFECVSVLFARLDSKEQNTLRNEKKKFWDAYCQLLHDDEFISAITQATAKLYNVKKRYEKLNKVIGKVLEEC